MVSLELIGLAFIDKHLRDALLWTKSTVRGFANIAVKNEGEKRLLMAATFLLFTKQGKYSRSQFEGASAFFLVHRYFMECDK
jgi:hypothetical protein